MSLAIVIATIDRPYAVQRLIRSARELFEDIPIYVADQSDPTPQMDHFYKNNAVIVVWMDHDCGVCESRNAAVQQVKEDYFVLCDDDFIFNEKTTFHDALKVLELSRDIGVVGGRLEDISKDGVSRWNRFWELYFQYDKKNGLLITVPIHMLAPKSEMVHGIKYYLCDAVMNFAVFRKSMFSDIIKWDPQFKSNGEHEDFYLNLKVNGNHKVAYLPSMCAEHHHPPSVGYANYRKRTNGWRLFMEKWGLEQHLELEHGLRIIKDIDTIHSPSKFSRAGFFKSPDLTYETDGSQHAGLFSVTSSGDLSPKRYYDENGNSLVPTCKTFFSLEVDSTGDVCRIGGVWRNEEHKRHHRRIKLRTPLVSSSDGVAMYVNYRAVVQQGHDFIIYAKPLNFGIEQNFSRTVFLTVSWRLGNEYFTFHERLHGYRQEVKSEEWNSLNIGVPRQAGLWTFEIHLYSSMTEGCMLLVTGDVAVVSEQSANHESLWVNAWSPASRINRHSNYANVVLNDRPDNGEVKFETSLLTDVYVEGVTLNMLTLHNLISTDIRIPSILLFDLFPYSCGGGRAVCEYVTDPEDDARFLIPFDCVNNYNNATITIDGVCYVLQ